MKRPLFPHHIRFLFRKSAYCLFAFLLLIPVLGTVCPSVFSPEAVRAYLSQSGSVHPNQWQPLFLPLESLSLDQYQLVL